MKTKLPDPGPGFRLLVSGEQPKDGDELYWLGQWIPAETKQGANCAYRRPKKKGKK